jgi:tetratricopeptide (TPR) repeat protein/DNA-binding XRE family transcriptional regulator
VAEVPSSFASLLRGLRTEAGMTQEELAEAAGLSSRAISYLERGEVTTPHKDTVRLLAGALGLAGPVRAGFEAAARGRPEPGRPESGGAGGPAGAGGPGPAARALPRDVAWFTGRQLELATLVDAAAAGAVVSGAVVSIHAIGGMAGIGKTAFAVHAAHRLASRFPGGQIFLPLHGHTPGQQPAEPATALASLLLTVGVPAAQIPDSLEARMALWRDQAAQRQLLLILDDAVSSEQILPLLPGSGGSLVLVTSRRHLSALDDATPVSLDTLPPGEAAELLARLTGRAGLNPREPAIGELARLCGSLPLAIGMVARQLRHHPAWTPAGRAAELAAAADRLEVLATENLSVAAAFDLTYTSLTDDQQRLFRRLGLHPGADVDAYALAALAGVRLAEARRGLEDLYDHYLLTEPAPGRYRLHDLLREHARALADRFDSDDERTRTTAGLLDYYQHTAARANTMIARRVRPAPGSGARAWPTPAAAPELADPEQALAWARAERASLLACLDHVTSTGQHDRVTALTAGLSGLLLRDGPWTDAITRHITAIAAARDLGDQLSQANALNDLGAVQRMTCEFASAVQAHEAALAIYHRIGSRVGEANALGYLGIVHQVTGDFPAAVGALNQALSIHRETGNRLGEANTLNSLGGALRLTGDYPAAAGALDQALTIHHQTGNRLGEAIAFNYLGEVRQVTGDFPAAVGALNQALSIFRDLGNRLGEANALNSLGGVLRLTGDYPAAARALDQALDSYRQIGERLGEVGALNERGTLHRVSGELAPAETCHRDALGLAREMGSSRGEADALAGLGRCALAAGRTTDGKARLSQALALLEQIGSADAAEVSAELDALPGQEP